MRKSNLLAFILVLLSGSCQTDTNKGLQEVNISEPFPLVLDTIGIERLIFPFDDDKPSWLTTAFYQVYYIGLKKDTIYLSPYINNSPPPPPPPGANQIREAEYEENNGPFSEYFVDWLDGRFYKNWDETKILLRVDTLSRVAKAYPVQITNLDTDTIFIGSGSQIPMVMEALDSMGNWKPIQTQFSHGCGVGLGSIILPPNQCVVLLAPIFEGDFKTSLRLSLGNNHSEAFSGFINYRQFESRFNEHGDYKDEYIKEKDEEL